MTTHSNIIVTIYKQINYIKTSTLTFKINRAMKKAFYKFFSFVFLFVFGGFTPLFSYAQKSADPLFPNGFHIGLRGEGYLISSLKFTPYNGSNAIYADPCLGSKAGIEVSYHFARHFGVSLGIDYGTTLHSGSRHINIPLSQYYEGMEDQVTTFGVYDVIHQFQIPLRMEFHFPLYNSNWMFCSAVGVNFVNVFETIGYAVSKKNFFPNSSVSDIFTVSIQKENENEIPVLEGELSRPKEMTRKLEADLFLNLGVYYRLPYNDLIRFQAVFNYSFKDRMTGKYTYLATPNECGTISYRHNYIGLELAYIHCFKTKAQREAAKDLKRAL